MRRTIYILDVQHTFKKYNTRLRNRILWFVLLKCLYLKCVWKYWLLKKQRYFGPDYFKCRQSEYAKNGGCLYKCVKLHFKFILQFELNFTTPNSIPVSYYEPSMFIQYNSNAAHIWGIYTQADMIAFLFMR